MGDKIVEKLKKFRKENGFTQEQFSAILGVKRTTYAHQEKNGIPTKYLEIYSTVLYDKFGITFEELVNPEVKRNRTNDDIINAISIIEQQLREIKIKIK